MTPSWLKAHAFFIDTFRSTTADQITFNQGTIKDAAILKVALVDHGILADGTPLTVNITVTVDARIGELDSDIRYGVSDGTTFIGFQTPGKRHYDIDPPCFGIQASSGDTLTGFNQRRFDRSPIPTASFYPHKFVFTFKLDKPLGSCFTAHDGGFNKTVEYSKQLKLSQGLKLEVYKVQTKERVGIKYIKVTVK